MRNYIYLTIIAGSAFFLMYNFKNLGNNFFQSSNNPEKKIENFYYYLKNYYVDKIDLDSLSSEIIKDVVKRLDPHSFYISKNELPIVNESMRGSFEGIGVNFFFINDTVSIIRVLKGSPAEKFGLIAGDRTFEPWTVTVLNDQSFKFRAFFEAWSSNIQALQQNFQNSNTIADYQSVAKVRQMDRKGNIIRTYRFEGIWPSNISAIELDWGTNDTPEEYTVEFQVQYWTYDTDVDSGNQS